MDTDEESNYPYATARVRAKKAKLLKHDAYQKMMLMSVPEISRYLGESEYRREMAEFGGVKEGAALVEWATYKNLARVLKDVLNYCTAELKEMVASYLRKWDAHNVKVILRGKYASATEDEVEEQLIPAGSFDIAFLHSLMKRTSVDDIITQAMRRGLTLSGDAFEGFRATRKLSMLEDSIDKGYYARLLETDTEDEAKAIFISLIRREIDVHNLQTVLRLKAEGLQPQQKLPYLLPGGLEFGLKTLRQLVEYPTAGDILTAIRAHRSYSNLSGASDNVGHGWVDLRMFAIALDRMHAIESQKLERLYPLSVLPVLDYMLRKENEVKNIRILARGKQSGLSIEEIRSVLVI